MNIGGLFGALTPVFFVLALGYLAGKRNAFDADQSAGLSKLALTFALPASLFVSMTDIPKDLLLQQGLLVLALILSHAGLFVVAWVLLRRVKSLSGTPSIIYALMLATSATPVFGLAVLEPLLGRTSGGAVGLVALAINLTVPPAVILLEMDAAAKDLRVATNSSKPSAIVTGLNAGLKSPLLWAPILATNAVLRREPPIARLHEQGNRPTPHVKNEPDELPKRGLPQKPLRRMWLSQSTRNSWLPQLASERSKGQQRFPNVVSPFAREALVCCSFPLATVVVLFAARYKAVESEAASMLLVSTLALVVTVPTILWLSH